MIVCINCINIINSKKASLTFRGGIGRKLVYFRFSDLAEILLDNPSPKIYSGIM